MFARRNRLAHRALGAIDFAIDFATLGEYGLEPLPAAGPCRERSRDLAVDPSASLDWEALAGAGAGSVGRARRGRCEHRAGSSARPRLSQTR